MAKRDRVGNSDAKSATIYSSSANDADFLQRTALWIEVIDNLGPTLCAAQVCDAAFLTEARRSYDAWRATELRRHTLAMQAVVARIREGHA